MNNLFIDGELNYELIEKNWGVSKSSILEDNVKVVLNLLEVRRPFFKENLLILLRKLDLRS